MERHRWSRDKHSSHCQRPEQEDARLRKRNKRSRDLGLNSASQPEKLLRGALPQKRLCPTSNICYTLLFSRNLTYRLFFSSHMIQCGGRLPSVCSVCRSFCRVVKGRPAEPIERRLNRPPISVGGVGGGKTKQTRLFRLFGSDCSPLPKLVITLKDSGCVPAPRATVYACDGKRTDLQTSRGKKKKKKEDVTLAHPNLEAGSTKITLLSMV